MVISLIRLLCCKLRTCDCSFLLSQHHANLCICVLNRKVQLAVRYETLTKTEGRVLIMSRACNLSVHSQGCFPKRIHVCFPLEVSQTHLKVINAPISSFLAQFCLSRLFRVLVSCPSFSNSLCAVAWFFAQHGERPSGSQPTSQAHSSC